MKMTFALPFAALITFSALGLMNPSLFRTVTAEDVKSVVSTNSVRNLLYVEGDSLTEYQRERCRLDIHLPSEKTDKRKNASDQASFATIVWFHGGGLSGGEKSFPKPLLDKGVAVVAVNYRLHPKVRSPAYVEDAAAAVAWAFKNIERYGGDPKRIYVSGHSAGGYLTSMVGLDKRWLAAHDIDSNEIAGLIPYSGHTITHFTVRKERGIDGKQPIVDEMAPLFHVRKDAPPLLLITGDRELEMMGRYEENAYLWRMMQVVGHADTELHELDGYNHGRMAEPAHPLLLQFIRRLEGPQSGNSTRSR